MQTRVTCGCRMEGELPGPLHVRHRAAELHSWLTAQTERILSDPLSVIDWVNLYTIAVNEENAAGGRVITAPADGAAGIIPAVMHHYDRFASDTNDDGVVGFLFTAGAIGMPYKINALVLGAEVDCRGEVGMVCSMAAGVLTAILGDAPAQVENVAEIDVEHNLGLTYDLVSGLVQTPCIEHNAMASVRAVSVVCIALRGGGTHYVPLDFVVKTMRETGADMKTKHKETAYGGLVMNIVEC